LASLSLLLAATAPATGFGMVDADLAVGLARCAALKSEDARLTCYDGLAARAETAPAVPAAPAVPPSEAITAAPAPGAPLAPRNDEALREAFGVLLYRENYLLPVTYNANSNTNIPEQDRIDIPFLADGALDDVEMKFQLSFEVPFWTRILQQNLDMYFAYTQLAFFQAYNREYSSPFRETNYEPELGLFWQPDVSALGWRLTGTRLALNHQSNGRSEPLSRSWNRLVGQAEAERGDLSLAVRLWMLLDNEPPDNPDIEDYLGYGELHASYKFGKSDLGLMLRSVRHPTVQLDWSYPLGRKLKVYMQYFNGYGESLLDYNHSINRIGVGFLVNDWP
jgi:phospholipase A1